MSGLNCSYKLIKTLTNTKSTFSNTINTNKTQLLKNSIKSFSQFQYQMLIHKNNNKNKYIQYNKLSTSLIKTPSFSFSDCAEPCSNCSCQSSSNTKTKIDVNEANFEDKLKALNYDIISCIEEGKYEEGIELSDFYLSLIEEKFGSAHNYYSSALNNKAFLLKLTGKKEEAKEIYEKILSNYFQSEKNVFLNPQIKNIVIVKQNLATILRDLAKPKESIKHYEELFAIIKNKEFRVDVNIEVNILISASGAYRALKQYETAEQLLSGAESLVLSNYGEDNLPMAHLLNQKALLFQEQEKYDVALICLTKSLEIKETILDKNHPEIVNSRNLVDKLMSVMGKKSTSVLNEGVSEDDVDSYELKNVKKRGNK